MLSKWKLSALQVWVDCTVRQMMEKDPRAAQSALEISRAEHNQAATRYTLLVHKLKGELTPEERAKSMHWLVEAVEDERRRSSKVARYGPTLCCHSQHASGKCIYLPICCI